MTKMATGGIEPPNFDDESTIRVILVVWRPYEKPFVIIFFWFYSELNVQDEICDQ